MEAKAAALRLALEQTDQLTTLLEDNDIYGEYLERAIKSTRRELTERLRGIEMQLWTRAGLPEQQRAETERCPECLLTHAPGSNTLCSR